MNQFLDILNIASTKNWCVEPFCTTCGAQEYRKALRGLAQPNVFGLVEALSTLELNDLWKYPDWRNAIHIALSEIHIASDMDKVLRSWLPNISKNILLADIVLFYFVRRGSLFAPMSIEMLYEWRNACIGLAISTKNESLFESLIYTLGRDIKNNAFLWDEILNVSENSQNIQLALKQTFPDS
jgi:hypothetical protein